LRAKNRMRVIRTSGSVRGGDGNTPAYSARRLHQRPWLAVRHVELVVAAEGVGLEDSSIAGEMRLGMPTGAVARVVEHRRRRVWPAERAIVAHINPTSPGVGLALGQDRHGRVVSVQSLGGKNMARGEVSVPDGRQIIMLPNGNNAADSAAERSLRSQGIGTAAIEGVTVLLQREGMTWRAEPYSDLPWVEWDLLIGAGRFEAVDLQKAADRLNWARPMSGRGDLDVLRIALAYAARAQRKPEFIELFLRDLTTLFAAVADARLLTLDRHEEQSDERLVAPLFRWGLDLIAQRAPRTVLPRTFQVRCYRICYRTR